MTRGQSGYSLLELMVVLAIMALVMTAGLPFAVRALDGLSVESDARLAASRLRELRTVAMDLQQDLRFVVSQEAPATLVAPDGRRVHLGSGAIARIEGGDEDGVLVLGWDGSVSGSLLVSRGNRQLRLRQRDAYGAIVIEAVP
jgi:prepilin-type N-terminal cleavage/methylation domain-containing protein